MEKSYASTVSGKNEQVQRVEKMMRKAVLCNSDLMKVSDIACVVLCKVRDVNLINNIDTILLKEGFTDV